jgi:beta-ureidopropionase / N-carbamoyl-L-amino-acid hydrolase
MIALDQLNAMPATEFVTALGGIFEHSPWVAERVAGTRPFASLAALHEAMCAAVGAEGDAAQLALIRAHPELASRAAIAGDLTDASNREQGGAGLKSLTKEQFSQLTRLNRDYGARFNFPFILAVKGHNPDSIIAALAARILHTPEQEQRTALEQIARIARFRLEDLVAQDIGSEILARADELAKLSDDAEGLTCAYLTAAHQATAQRLRDYMLAGGLAAHIDDVGNVIGRLECSEPGAKTLLTGSHYDTVSNAGRYDGRLGVLLPIGVAARLKREGVQLPFHLEIIGFAEEEGLRFQSTFLGSSAVAGAFDASVLERTDRDGTSMRAAMMGAGHDPARIPAIARQREAVAGFIEVHIEQGPVLLDAGHATGVVTGIAGSRRSLVEVTGLAGHAGTVPMNLRKDAAAGAAEIVLMVEARCARDPGLVGTVGQLNVPGGAMNVIPGHCALSIDLRSVDDALRARAAADIDAGIAGIAARRRLDIRQTVVLDVAAVPCTPSVQQQIAASIERTTGQPAHSLPSGAGHDTMMMARLTDVGMLFVRCGNDGISHHPAESLTAADARLAADVFRDFLLHYKAS